MPGRRIAWWDRRAMDRRCIQKEPQIGRAEVVRSCGTAEVERFPRQVMSADCREECRAKNMSQNRPSSGYHCNEPWPLSTKRNSTRRSASYGRPLRSIRVITSVACIDRRLPETGDPLLRLSASLREPTDLQSAGNSPGNRVDCSWTCMNHTYDR